MAYSPGAGLNRSCLTSTQRRLWCLHARVTDTLLQQLAGLHLIPTSAPSHVIQTTQQSSSTQKASPILPGWHKKSSGSISRGAVGRGLSLEATQLDVTTRRLPYWTTYPNNSHNRVSWEGNQHLQTRPSKNHLNADVILLNLECSRRRCRNLITPRPAAHLPAPDHVPNT